MFWNEGGTYEELSEKEKKHSKYLQRSQLNGLNKGSKSELKWKDQPLSSRNERRLKRKARPID